MEQAGAEAAKLGPSQQAAPSTQIIQLCSHVNKLLALTDNSEIWWGSDDNAGNVTWLRIWPPPGASTLGASV